MLNNYSKLANKNYGLAPVTDLSKPNKETLARTSEATKLLLEKNINVKIKSTTGQTTYNQISTEDNKYIRYTPTQQGLGHNSDAKQRIIRLTEMPKDPLEPVKFKHKRIPRDSNDAPVPVVHSPPRKLTMKDMQDWKIPPCISNWKNAKGYTIPLEMRLSADGRNLKDFSVSEKFSKFADILYITEMQARKEIDERNKIQEGIKMCDVLKKEQELRDAAKEARQNKIALAVSNISSVNTHKTDDSEMLLENKRLITNEELEAAKMERNNLRNQRKKEIERDRRIEVGGNKKAKLTRDLDRDISEKIALGQAQPTSKETMIDSRLYNQTTGLEAGFKDEEDYDLYDKPLFADRTSASIYKNVKVDTTLDEEGGENTLESKTLMEKIQKRGKMFEGAEVSKSSGGKPIEFEKNKEEYGLNDIHSKKNKKDE